MGNLRVSGDRTPSAYLNFITGFICFSVQFPAPLWQNGAIMLIRGTVDDWWGISLFLTILIGSFATRYWRFFVQWLDGIRGRDWLTVSAIIDVVSVTKQTEQGRGGERIIGYLATLTFFYRNPELQMGEFSRMFDGEDEAHAWTASYKGRTVMVHVDPCDPTHSVLRKEEL
jgi:hypothetical protein